MPSYCVNWFWDILNWSNFFVQVNIMKVHILWHDETTPVVDTFCKWGFPVLLIWRLEDLLWFASLFILNYILSVLFIVETFNSITSVIFISTCTCTHNSRFKKKINKSNFNNCQMILANDMTFFMWPLRN